MPESRLVDERLNMGENRSAIGLALASLSSKMSDLLLQIVFEVSSKRPCGRTGEKRKHDENQSDQPSREHGGIDTTNEQRKARDREPGKDSVNPVGNSMSIMKAFELFVDAKRLVLVLRRFGVPASEFDEAIDSLLSDIGSRNPVTRF